MGVDGEETFPSIHPSTPMRLPSRSPPFLSQPRPHPRASRLVSLSFHPSFPSPAHLPYRAPPSSIHSPVHAHLPSTTTLALSRSSAALATKREPKHRRCFPETQKTSTCKDTHVRCEAETGSSRTLPPELPPTTSSHRGRIPPELPRVQHLRLQHLRAHRADLVASPEELPRSYRARRHRHFKELRCPKTQYRDIHVVRFETSCDEVE